MVADNALFRSGATCLELGFDQRNKPCRSFSECKRVWQHVLERDEADVDSDKIWRFIQQARGQQADIGRLEQSNLAPVTQGFMQLRTTDVYGVDTPCPTLEQKLRKPAGRRTDIQADTFFRVKGKIVESGSKLDAASRDVRVSGAGTKDRVSRQFVRCFSYRPVIGEYKPGFNRGLGLGAAFEQAALDEKTIGALASGNHWVLLRHRNRLQQEPWSVHGG